MQNTKIQWCDHTFNPWIGCTKVSPACDNCYAEQMAARFNMAKWGNDERVLTSQGSWKNPKRWDKRTAGIFKAWERAKSMRRMTDKQLESIGFIKPVNPKVFCGSMCDVFDNQVPQRWREYLFSLIEETPHLDWLLLTKRIANANTYIRAHIAELKDPIADHWATPDNIWVGATVCNQEEANRDIPKLLDTPAAKRFLSIEPMLGAIDLTRWLEWAGLDTDRGLSNPGIDWVIVGGESGRNARPLHPLWVTSIRDQCKAAGVPFFFKQWGEWAPRYDGWFTLPSGEDLATVDPQCKRWPHVIRLTESGHNGRDLEHVDGGEDVFMQRIGKKQAGCRLGNTEYLEVPHE